MPEVPAGWYPSNVVTRPFTTEYPGSTAQTYWNVDAEPAYGATSGAFRVSWSVEWAGVWKDWAEGGRTGFVVKCANGANWAAVQPFNRRGAAPGGPGTLGWVGAGVVEFSYPGANSRLLCPDSYGGYDHIEVLSNADGAVLSKHYPPGHPSRPAGVPAGQGTLTRWLECVAADGSSTRVEQTWSGNISSPGSYDLAALTCPPGTVVGSFGMDWTPAVPGSETQPVAPATDTPAWVAALPAQYPECYSAGADCRLELWDASSGSPVSCGLLAADCPLWYVSPTKVADYRCTWGPYPVDLSVCAAFRDPGSLLPNASLDASGAAVLWGDWPALDLDSETVALLVDMLDARYADAASACDALGEAVRVTRGSAPVIVPDVVVLCQDYSVSDALEYIDWTGGEGSREVAIDALAWAAAFGPVPGATHPDCDRVDAGGTCSDPSVRQVAIGDTTWSAGPRTWPGPSTEVVVNVRQKCQSLVQAASPGLTADAVEDRCETTPIFVPGGRASWGKEAAEHDLDVINGSPELAVLEYMSNANKAATGVRRGWYRSGGTYLQPCNSVVATTDCDEYPFYSTVEGGPGAYATYGQGVLRRIDRLDNRREGVALGTMYRDRGCDMTSAVGTNGAPAGGAPGTKFVVVPLPEVDVPSFYLCPEH